MKVVYRVNGEPVDKLTATPAEKAEFEAMLKERKFCGVATDDTFLSGLPTLDRQFAHRKQLEHVTKTAMRNGYKPKHTDFYCAALAQYPGDPRAFLNHGQARGAAKQYAEELGVAADGAIKTKGREPERDPWESPKHKLNPKIVKRIMKRRLANEPDLAKRDKRELAEEIVATHGKQK